MCIHRSGSIVKECFVWSQMKSVEMNVFLWKFIKKFMVFIRDYHTIFLQRFQPHELRKPIFSYCPRFASLRFECIANCYDTPALPLIYHFPNNFFGTKYLMSLVSSKIRSTLSTQTNSMETPRLASSKQIDHSQWKNFLVEKKTVHFWVLYKCFFSSCDLFDGDGLNSIIFISLSSNAQMFVCKLYCINQRTYD